jgi:hypothetical protein
VPHFIQFDHHATGFRLWLDVVFLSKGFYPNENRADIDMKKPCDCAKGKTVAVEPYGQQFLAVAFAALSGWHKEAATILALIPLFPLDFSGFHVILASALFAVQYHRPLDSIIPRDSYFVNTPEKRIQM